MEPLLKSDVFFVITTVAVIILTTVVVVALYYLIRILRNVKDVSKMVKDEGGLIKGDIDSAREGFKKGVKKVIRKISSSKPKRRTKKNK